MILQRYIDVLSFSLSILCCLLFILLFLYFSFLIQNDATSALRRFRDFFSAARPYTRTKSTSVLSQPWREEEKRLHTTLLRSKSQFREDLADDFNTPAALNTLFTLLAETYKYELRLSKHISFGLVWMISLTSLTYFKSLHPLFPLILSFFFSPRSCYLYVCKTVCKIQIVTNDFGQKLVKLARQQIDYL